VKEILEEKKKIQSTMSGEVGGKGEILKETEIEGL
jgi:hypothetical protein